ncbi:hypothetical protein BaRGS_00001297, partial [Batillaria attramentaria]
TDVRASPAIKKKSRQNSVLDEDLVSSAGHEVAPYCGSNREMRVVIYRFRDGPVDGAASGVRRNKTEESSFQFRFTEFNFKRNRANPSILFAGRSPLTLGAVRSVLRTSRSVCVYIASGFSAGSTLHTAEEWLAKKKTKFRVYGSSSSFIIET